jgi:hypothetical protein
MSSEAIDRRAAAAAAAPPPTDRALTGERRGNPFWYRGGVFWPGVIAMVGATTVAVLMANLEVSA